MPEFQTAQRPALKIDAHQHFWKYDRLKHEWITDDMVAIANDFLPPHLEPILEENGFDGCVAVQVDQSDAENDFLLDLAHKNDWIKGVIGWIDLQSVDIGERLARYKTFEKLKGFRHILQGEEDRALMLKPSFLRGTRALQQMNYTYDILIFPDQLQYAIPFVRSFPEQKFVLDHLAKPYIKDKKIEGWQADIQQLASCKNVSCKISGMVTEAHWQRWRAEDFTPYLDAVVESFGTGRVMFGSDWPVCLLAAGYRDVLGIVSEYFSTFTKSEQDGFFGGNAVQFYNL
jgi:L-fuconolactonase